MCRSIRESINGVKLTKGDSSRWLVTSHRELSPLVLTSHRELSPLVLKLSNRMKAAREAGDEGYSFGGHGFSAGRGNSITMYAADSWEQMADRLGFEGEKKETFLKEIERYNELCRNKKDEDFGKDPRLLFPLDKPPYYAFFKEVYVGNEFLCTTDGLWTNDDQQVLDMKKQPIPGLYATGNASGRRWGVQYSTSIGGLSIGMAVTLGAELGRYLGSK